MFSMMRQLWSSAFTLPALAGTFAALALCLLHRPVPRVTFSASPFDSDVRNLAPIFLSPDSKVIAICKQELTTAPPVLGWLYNLVGHKPQSSLDVRLFSLETGAEIAVFDHARYGKFSADGSTVAVARVDGTVDLFDYPLRKPLGRIALSGLAVATLTYGLGRWRARRSGGEKKSSERR